MIICADQNSKIDKYLNSLKKLELSTKYLLNLIDSSNEDKLLYESENRERLINIIKENQNIINKEVKQNLHNESGILREENVILKRIKCTEKKILYKLDQQKTIIRKELSIIHKNKVIISSYNLNNLKSPPKIS